MASIGIHYYKRLTPLYDIDNSKDDSETIHTVLILLSWFGRIHVREHRRGNQKWTIQGNMGHTRQIKIKQNHNTICVEYHYAQTNTNNVNKT